jgi:hypothetical protein
MPPNIQTDIGIKIKLETDAKDTSFVISIKMTAIANTITVITGYITNITPVIEATHLPPLKWLNTGNA